MASATDLARVAALSRGETASKTLSEILAIDFRTLLDEVAPKAALPAFEREGISRRMALCGEALLGHCGPDGLARLSRHGSDTVRGLALFGLVRHNEACGVEQLLALVRPFAADAHFGVREWAWLAVRPHLAEQLDEAIQALARWTRELDVNLRRFAVESLRPRGVWCKHIAALRQNPAQGLPLLEPMRLEQLKYAQDSVSNWLNDAAKDHPDWVRDLCQRWRDETNDNPATRRMTTRGLRSLN